MKEPMLSTTTADDNVSAYRTTTYWSNLNPNNDGMRLTRNAEPLSMTWVPTGKTFASSTTKVESEPPNGSNADIPNQSERNKLLMSSARYSLNYRYIASILQRKDSEFVAKQERYSENRELGFQTTAMNSQVQKLVPLLFPLAVKTKYIYDKSWIAIAIPPSFIAMPRTTGINPMIQPEPEDLPKDNPKLEIAVLRWQSAPASEY
ncbi:hypothetical protein Tco_0950413 [Tanacetum coccineum]